MSVLERCRGEDTAVAERMYVEMGIGVQFAALTVMS